MKLRLSESMMVDDITDTSEPPQDYITDVSLDTIRKLATPAKGDALIPAGTRVILALPENIDIDSGDEINPDDLTNIVNDDGYYVLDNDKSSDECDNKLVIVDDSNSNNENLTESYDHMRSRNRFREFQSDLSDELSMRGYQVKYIRDITPLGTYSMNEMRVQILFDSIPRRSNPLLDTIKSISRVGDSYSNGGKYYTSPDKLVVELDLIDDNIIESYV